MKFNYFSILFNILPLGKSSVILQEALYIDIILEQKVEQKNGLV